MRNTSAVSAAVSVILMMAGAGCSTGTAEKNPLQTVTAELPKLGHRNWIVIADSAYPWQSREGIETVVTSGDQIESVRAVLDAVDHSRHVRPIIYLDSELPHVSEADAPGVSQYREQLAKLLGSRATQSLPHEKIISKLDESAKTFHILIVKTNLTVPYTSVFLQLDCGYWGPDAEKRLRDAIGAAGN